MTKTRRRRLAYVLVLMVGLGATVALTLSAVSDNLMYFHPPSDVSSGEVPVNTRFRIGGLVQPGSIHHSKDSALVTFRIADCNASVPVRYVGVLPDLFRAGQGVIAHGQLNDKGWFVADDILAKHDETYESPEVAKATTDDRGNSCMPGDVQVSG